MVWYKTDFNTLKHILFKIHILLLLITNFVLWWVDLHHICSAKEMGCMSVNNACIIPTLVF